MNCKKGIDVSYSQGDISWPQVKGAGVDFAMVRLGRRAQSGGLGADTHFQRNVAGAVAAGVDLGAYFYSSAKSVAEAREEAEFTLRLLSGYPEAFTYPIAYDMETEFTAFASQSRELNTAIAKAYLSALEAAGYYAMLYTTKSFAADYLNMPELRDYDFWLAHVGAKGAPLSATNYTGPYGMWQYSWTGRVGGISGDVDLDYAYQDYPAVIRAAGLNGFSGEDREEIVNELRECCQGCARCQDKEFFQESLASIERLAGEMRDRLDK